MSLSPCLSCARIIYSMGISRVVYLNSYAEYKGLAKDEGLEFLDKFGVTTDKYQGSIEHATEMN